MKDESGSAFQFMPEHFESLGTELGMPLTWVDRNVAARIAKRANEILNPQAPASGLDALLKALEEK